MAFKKIQASVDEAMRDVTDAMAPLKDTATLAKAEAEKIVEQGYVEFEVRIPIPQNALTKVLGMPKVFVLPLRFKLGGRDG